MQKQYSTSSARIPVVKLIGSFRYAHARSYEQIAEAIVDARDAEHLSQFVWGLVPKPNGTQYAHRSTWDGERTETFLMHKDIWERHNGEVPDGLTIDHRNRDGLDNRLENLRLATTAQQGYNKAAPVHSSTGYKGVHGAGYKRFKSFIRFTGESGRMRFYLGQYQTPEEAATAYNHAASRLHGEFANLSEIPDGVISPERSAEILAVVLDRLAKPVCAD